MTTTTTKQIINATILIGSRTRLTKVIKHQLFTVENGMKHHLIGNSYYNILTNIPIDVVQEKSVSKYKIT
jgi:hypothetical protein